MRKLYRRTEADYIRISPYYILKSHDEERSRGVVWNFAWNLLLFAVALALLLAGGRAIHHYWFSPAI